MWELDKSLTEYVGGSSQSLDELLDSLESQKQITAEEKAQIKETGSVTIGSRTITFNTARTLVELYDAGELKIGDYVNYQNPTSGSYTSLGSKTGMEDLITDIGIKTVTICGKVKYEDIEQIVDINIKDWKKQYKS